MERLFDQLDALANSNMYPFHMPGHKRNLRESRMADFYHHDITEIDGFDNMHKPEGILRDIQTSASKMYGSDETLLLVNGSTSGILTALSAVANRGEKILMARNCHKSAYHAVYINGYDVEYIHPEIIDRFGICGGVSPDKIREAIDRDSEIKAVFITSPTYDGIVSDIEKIAKICHKNKIPLIVDEAHGAHFFLDTRFPQCAIQGGADLVILSLHKTLPSPTQTALLHMQGEVIDREKVRFYNDIYQTSSPSYLLMTGIDECLRELEKNGRKLAKDFFLHMEKFSANTKELRNLRILTQCDDIKNVGCVKDVDPGKIVVSCKNTNLSGNELYQLLRTKYELQLEMAEVDYVVAIATICDTRDGFCRLADALEEIDRGLDLKSVKKQILTEIDTTNLSGIKIEDAIDAKKTWIKLENACGRYAGDFLQIYPPGIPLAVPGERITSSIIQTIRSYIENGFRVEGVREEMPQGKYVEVRVADV